jgi:hypothetical protein
MKKILLSAVAVLLSVGCSNAAGRSTPIDQFIGKWCGSEGEYIGRGDPSYINPTGDCHSDEETLVIAKDPWGGQLSYGTKDALCKIDAVKVWTDWKEVRDTKNMGAPSVQLNASCFDTEYKPLRKEVLVSVLTKGILKVKEWKRN